MKTCPKCNAQCADNVQFCPECGFSFASAGSGAPQSAGDPSQNFQQGDNPQGYNQQSFNQQSFNQQGYTQQGFNQQGFNQQGYNQQGFNQQQAYGGPQGFNSYGGYQSPSNLGIAQRGIALCIILSIVTCGIYAIYWMIKINDELNAVSCEQNPTSGVVVWLLSWVTCNIYGLIWMYKMGGKCDNLKGDQGNSGILYLLLSFFGLGIVSLALMQDTLNKLA